MTLPLTWDQMPLTAQQQTLIQQLIAWNQNPNNSPPDPPLTYSQIKNLRQWMVSLSALVDPGRTAMSNAVRYYQNQNEAAFEAANP